MLGDVCPTKQLEAAPVLAAAAPHAPAREAAAQVVCQKGPGVDASLVGPGAAVYEPVATLERLEGTSD